MKSFNNISHIYFLGIGGIGMSALARYFKSMGKIVSGYDKTSTSLTDELKFEGISINFSDDLKLIDTFITDTKNIDQVLIVLTPAIPNNSSQYNYFLSNNFRIVKRSALLGMITADESTLAVAGTHGKTTTSSLITWILKNSNRNCTAFLGGIASNFNSNYVEGNVHEKDHVIVVEADEFDRSFLTLFPDYALITSMDADHLDIYGSSEEMNASYRKFASQVKSAGKLILKKGLDINQRSVVTYSINDSTADYFANNIRIEKANYYFDIVSINNSIKNVKSGLPGRHNVENALAASAMLFEYGLSVDEIKTGIETYKGVKRRFEYIVKNDEHIYIDDYAHHPEEIKMAILSAKELFPGKKLAVVFQPHLYTRTRDFADGFAISLSLADEIYLLDIYPARELPIEGINSEMLLNKISAKNKYLVDKTGVIQSLRKENPQLLMTLGAGDIDQLVNPIKKLLNDK